MADENFLEGTDNRAHRTLVYIEYVLLSIAGVALLAMMVLITANAVGRYLFNAPISGILTLTELYLLIALVFFGLPHLQRDEGNIKVDIISKDFEPLRQELIKIVVRTLILGIFALIAYEAALSTLDLLQRGATRSVVIPLPSYLSWGIFTVGVTVFCLRLIVQVYFGSQTAIKLYRGAEQ